VKARVVD